MKVQIRPVPPNLQSGFKSQYQKVLVLLQIFFFLITTLDGTAEVWYGNNQTLMSVSQKMIQKVEI